MHHLPGAAEAAGRSLELHRRMLRYSAPGMHPGAICVRSNVMQQQRGQYVGQAMVPSNAASAALSMYWAHDAGLGASADQRGRFEGRGSSHQVKLALVAHLARLK